MLKFFLKGGPVPSWLQKQEPIPGHPEGFKPGTLVFADHCIVTSWGGSYHVMALTGRPAMRLDNAHNLVLRGQSPPGRHGPVRIWMVNRWMVLTIILTALTLWKL